MSFASLLRADVVLLIVEFLYLGLVPALDPLRFRPFLKRPPWLCPALLRGFGARSHARDARSRIRDAAGGIQVGRVDAEPGAPAVLEPLERKDCQTTCVHKSKRYHVRTCIYWVDLLGRATR